MSVGANRMADQAFEFVPLAMMFQHDSYKTVNPSSPEGGFCTQADQRNIILEDNP